MEATDIAYFVCINNECEHHRGVFRDGDSLHEECARERLILEGQETPRARPGWIWIAAPLAALTLAGDAVWLARRRRPQGP